MAAATLSRSGLHKTQCNLHSLHCFWKRTTNYSISQQIGAPKITGTQLHQIKQFSRFSHPIFPKTNKLSSHFSTRASSSSSQKSGLVGWYLTLLKTRPISTKSITASLIYSAADISSQTIVAEQYDFTRTLRMAGYGLVILGPSVHYWYTLMSTIFPKRDLGSTLKKMVLGQTTYGPAMTVIFLSVNAAVQGESGTEIVARLKRDLASTLINGVMYWPLCDFVTFKFVPVHLQPLVTNSFSYLWTVYLTYKASLGKVAMS